MRLPFITTLIGLLTLSTAAAPRGQADMEPEGLLQQRLQFSADEVAQARGGQPVARMLASGGRDELGIVGAIRIDGDQNRLITWIQNIEHFRGAAELGLTRVVSLPASPASFADLALDAKDLGDLQQCRPNKCAIRLPGDALSRVQREVQWGSPDAAAQANTLVRQVLAGYATAYLEGGHAALDAYEGRAHSADLRGLLQRATTLTSVSPELVAYLEQFPAAAPAGVDHRLYWSSVEAGSVRVVSLHHLVLHRSRPGETIIADDTIYASRLFDTAVTVVALRNATAGGYYAIAGSRVKASQLGGAAAVVLRRQVERAALDTLRMYLGWLRESLAMQPAARSAVTGSSSTSR